MGKILSQYIILYEIPLQINPFFPGAPLHPRDRKQRRIDPAPAAPKERSDLPEVLRRLRVAPAGELLPETVQGDPRLLREIHRRIGAVPPGWQKRSQK